MTKKGQKKDEEKITDIFMLDSGGGWNAGACQRGSSCHGADDA